ncbi:hypothetical protein SAMN05428970_0028 [Agromyces sp. CF514]|uniref:DUF6325 family protein n=1 Tax=Agromyces sp. CF514 TaxID=1881031 RepID=UPI0008EB2306|nr:DUF6325 family protein [Agromyces sp. CF514]SFR66392.1 hypothetical protein SAMN05428970_0028 [Agromyces sp. CF514]
MAEFEYGPVDLYLVGFTGESPDQGTMDALSELVGSGEIRILDFLLVSRSHDDEITVVEFEDLGGELEIDIEVLEAGLVGDEDVEELSALIPAGTSAALVAMELVWAKRLASKFAASGAEVIQAERIPAPVVNAVLAEAEGAEA